MRAEVAARTLALGERARLLQQLRRRMDQLFLLRDVALEVPGLAAPLIVTQPADPEAPLDQMAARQREEPPVEYSAAGHAGDTAAALARTMVAAGTHLPYWALLWPSGIALAEALAADTEVVRGRRVLELGCGLGVSASVALACGARLWAADCFAEALLFCRYNTLRAAGHCPMPLLVDWRTEAGRAACLALAPLDVVLAADVLYEQEDIAPLLDLVPRLLAPEGVFWLAEPGRRVSLRFVAEARARGWLDRTTIYERAWAPEGKTVRVAVHGYIMPSA
jgi:predicted nicotinamide N-methyase